MNHIKVTQKEQNFAIQQSSKPVDHSQKALLLKKFRVSLNTRGIRGFIGLKRQFKLIDNE